MGLVAVLLTTACGGGGEPSAAVNEAAEEPEEEFTPEPIVVPEDCPEAASTWHLYAAGASWTNAKAQPYEALELCTSVPADNPFTVTQHNLKVKGVASRDHNFSIYTDSIALDRVFNVERFRSPGTKTFEVPALDAGAYMFRCDFHALTMKGVLVVE